MEVTTDIKALAVKKDDLEKIINSSTEQEVIKIITGINKGEKYWKQINRRMQDPRPNMGPYRPATFSMHTFDQYRECKIYKPFSDFLMKAVTKFPHLTLYVENGEFGFSPVFGVCYLNTERDNPYLIKFKENHLDKDIYTKMVRILYSKKNKNKHQEFGLEEIKSLSYYEY